MYSVVGPIGALFGGIACDRVGRKTTHVIADFCLFLGWTLIACAQNGNMILTGRIIEGVARSVACTTHTVRK